MKFSIQREAILKPLQMIIGVVERRQTMPILANTLLKVMPDQLSLLATDMEVELTGVAHLEQASEPAEITVPARKLLDLCRALPEQSVIEFTVEEQKIFIQSGRSRFTLMTLPASGFPNLEDSPNNIEFTLKSNELRYLIERVYFAMAQQDVRYYLNGMLLEMTSKHIRSVAADGNRLAMCTLPIALQTEDALLIVPRKGVVELLRLLGSDSTEVTVTVSDNHLRVSSEDYTFATKLIDGRFPNYETVVPKGGDKIVKIERDPLREALQRIAILSNEKFHGVKLILRTNKLFIQARNAEQEEALDELEIAYENDDLDIGFNVNYFLDVLNILPSKEVKLVFIDGNSSVLIEESENSDSFYVIMPMRL